MIKLTVENNQIVITASEVERSIVLQINGLKADGSRCWRAPLDFRIAVDAGSTVEENHGEITDDFRQWFREELVAQKALIAGKYADSAPSSTLGTVELFPGQVADATWLDNVGGKGFLFSQMRTGKTHTMHALLGIRNAFPALIVCPPGITFEHERAAKAAFPDLRVTVLSNGMTPLQRRNALSDHGDIVILGYNLLAKHSKIAYFGGLSRDQRAKELASGLYEDKELNSIPFRAVLADEAHNAKDPKSQQTRGLWHLGDSLPADGVKIAATGTASKNKLVGGSVDVSDIWALLRFVHPQAFPAKSKFLNKYLLMLPNVFGQIECHGLKAGAEKHWQLIFGPMFLRRLRSISTVQEIREIPVELDKKQWKVYKQMEIDALAEVGEELLFAPEGITARQKLVQMVGGMPLVSDNKIVKLTKPSPKVDTLIEWLGESEEKAIVFVDSVPMFRLIEEELEAKGIVYESFPGGLNDVQKTKVVERFRDDPAVKVILCSLRAANAGIDMSAATRMCFASLSDDATMVQQALDRNLGPTQDAAKVEVAFLIAKDTVDEQIYESFHLKKRNNEMMVGDRA